MADSKIPYIAAYGNITKALEGIKTASTPDQFTQDFLATKLGMKGGSPKPVIPFLKRTGFLGSDGTPTELYKRFRNKGQSGAAAAEAMKIGYAPLYAINEYVHDAQDGEIKGVIVQATGAEDGSRLVKNALGSFKALRAFADFDAPTETLEADDSPNTVLAPPQAPATSDLNLSYTINLHLPATSETAVFNAIFQSLREHILR